VSRRNSSSSCGARTRACRVHTRVNARSPFLIRTRPCIIFRNRNQTGLHRIPFNIGCNPAPLGFISHPMIIGLPLPKWLTGAIQQPVRFTGRSAFQRFEQQTRSNRWQHQYVNVIRHDDERSKLVMAHALSTKKRFEHNSGDCVVPQVNGAGACSVQIPIHPRESFAIGNFASRREARIGKTAVQMPSYEQPAILRIDVRKAASRRHALNSVVIEPKLSRSHECERGTHECVRHNYQ
jgi:hypothetical protein